MNKREHLLWQIICLISVLAFGYTFYKGFFKQSNLTAEWEKYEKEEVGTDKIMQKKVEKLDEFLKNKKDFKFKMKRNPSDLSSVIDYDGMSSLGIYRHFKLEATFYSKRRDEYRALLMKNDGSQNYYTVNDTISGGIISDINEKSLIFVKDGEEFIYEAGGNNEK